MKSRWGNSKGYSDAFNLLIVTEKKHMRSAAINYLEINEEGP